MNPNTQAYAMAGRLCDQLDIENGFTVEVEIWHSEHLVAEQTAIVFADVLKQRKALDVETLPKSFLTPRPNSEEKVREASTEKVTWDAAIPTTLIVIGHQPMLTDIANDLLGRTRLLKSPVLRPEYCRLGVLKLRALNG